MKFGLLGAMPSEINAIRLNMTNIEEYQIANRTFYSGLFANQPCVLAMSKCGKVSAAITVTILITQFNVDAILFTGVAGAVDSDVSIGDIIIGEQLYQHDMDPRPLFKRFEIPFSDKLIFKSSVDIINKMQPAVEKFADNFDQYFTPTIRKQFNITKPKVHRGMIATGDQFINNPLSHDGLKFPGIKVLATEMEGAAVAQVAEDFDIPYLILRTISDNANHTASVDFEDFCLHIASPYTAHLAELFIEHCR